MKSKFLTNKDHKNIKRLIETFVYPNDEPSYLVEMKNGEVWHIIREGKCDYEKCNSICCKFISLYGVQKIQETYYNGFGKKGNSGYLFDIQCKRLCKGKCKLWKKDNFPLACQQFPNPTDTTYIEIMKKCSFKFKILNKFKVIN